jgi:hypothetical protein
MAPSPNAITGAVCRGGDNDAADQPRLSSVITGFDAREVQVEVGRQVPEPVSRELRAKGFSLLEVAVIEVRFPRDVVRR